MKTMLSIKHTAYLWTYLLLWLLMPGVSNLMANPGEKEVPPPSLGFTENKGQIKPESDVRFYFRSNGVGFYLQSDGITYVWNRELENEKVIYEEIYPHIDLEFYFKETQLKYDFIVKPGGKVSDIRLRYAGHEDLNKESDGSISISHSLGRQSRHTQGDLFS